MPAVGLRLGVDLDTGRSSDDDEVFVSGDYHLLRDKDEDRSLDLGASITMTWDFRDLAYEPDQIDLSRESRLVIGLRDDVLDEISQLYFEGDPYNSTDPIGGASLPEAKARIIPLSKDSSGTLQGVFDIVLPSLPAADRSGRFSLQGHDLAIQRFHGRVRFFVPEEFYGGILGVYSPSGRTLREWEIVDHFIQWKTEDVPRGTYLARLISQQENEQAVHFQL